MSKIKRALLIFIAALMVFPTGLPITGAAATTDAMTAIEASLSSYKIGSTQSVDDGYIGIPVEISLYFDKDNFTVKSGYNGTPVIIYVVNTNTERIGTESDTVIIKSMLDRGYVVTVFDYKNNVLATGQALDWSVQGLRANVKNKQYLTDPIFPSGTYYVNHVVPAGYNVSLDNLYWEMDKHASDGTFDFIVNNWNTDFRGVKGDKLVKWVHEDGTRKTTLDTAKDGTVPVWYNASGTVDPNGEYTKVKYTVAQSITDVVKPDGSPIELNQYMNILYPTNPKNDVPVFCIASSSEHLTSTPQVADRPQLNGFLFRGYAGVVYDYAFVPMARDDAYGTYNGSTSTYSSAVTNDSDNYAVHMYDDKRVTTAAMRYIRYKALSEPSTYKFDTDHIGVVGNSKGGAMSFLGEKIIQSPLVENPSSYATTDELETAIDTKINSFISRRAHDGHHNETRYQNGDTESYTKDGITIDGGEKQPWLTYNGQEIVSGAQLIYASNGVCGEDISEGHAPQIVMCHEQDPWHYYGPLNEFANICYSHDIPMLQFEVPLAHTVAYGPDKNYNVDTYDAAFDFANYWLKGDAVKVLYTDPQNGSANVGVASPITIKFSGSVPESELSKITIKAPGKDAVSGVWKSTYGKTTWEFTPDVLEGNTMYTLTVPSDLKGENDVEMGTAYTANLYTEYNVNNKADSNVTTSKGTYFNFTAPYLSGDANRAKIRFRVTNDASNTAKLYAVDGFDANSPDSSALGELVGEVNIKGKGYYEIDATDYLMKNSGKPVTFLLTNGKTQGTSTIYASDFTQNINGVSVGEMSTIEHAAAPDTTMSLKVVRTNSGTKYAQHTIYNNSRIAAFNVNNILGFKLTEADYGRKFTFKVKVYDTISRHIQLRLNGNTSSSYETVDYTNGMYNFMTKENEWSTYSFDYVVYDTDFGKIGFKNKNLIVQVSHTGDLQLPLYVGEITVTETVTGITADNFSVSLENDGGTAYKEAEGEYPFALFDASGNKVADYETWKAALSAYSYGYTLKLMKNYTFTDNDLWSDFSTLSGAQGADGHIYNIDLNGYTIKSLNTTNSLFWLKNTSLAFRKTKLNISNGGILLKNTPLVSYESSTSAGHGKKFELNFNDVNIGILDNAYMDSIISSTAVTAGAETNVDMNFNECYINLPGDKLTPEYKTIFPAGGQNLNINYKITGGSLSLTSQRWIQIQDQREACVYYKGTDGKYMTLKMPSSALVSSAAYMLDGVAAASYAAASSENNITTYELSSTPLSTRYGVIPEEYEDVDKYPLVWFDESGTFKGASENLYGENSSTSVVGQAKTYMADNKYDAASNSYGANPLKAYIVLRKDYTMGSAEIYGNSAQIQGTLTIDLNGHTITQNKKSLMDSTAKRWGSSGDATIFPTEIAWEHGTIKANDNSLVHFTAWDANNSGDVANKDFTHSYNDITFQLAEGATLTSLFTIGQNSSTPTAASNAYVNITDCIFDFETVAPSRPLLLFNANSQYIKFKYNITGSEIYADSMENITISSVADGSSVSAQKNSSDELLKVYVTKANSGTFKDETLTVNGEIAGFIECDPQGSYAVYTLDEPTVPTIISALVKKYENIGTTEAPSYKIQTIDVLSVLTDEANTSSTSSTIQYFSSSGVKNNSLDSTENANQHWLIELDKAYTLGSIETVYSSTHKWVDFNVQVSLDNSVWTDLGTIRPEVAAKNGDSVSIPLNSANGKYIKLTVVKRNATTVDDESVAWGANLGAGCSLALYEIISIKKASEEQVDNSITTKYGVIPEEYASVNTYPFVWFDEAGNFKGGASKLYGENDNASIIGQAKAYLQGNVYNTTTKSYGENEKKAFVLLRKEYTMGSAERYGNMSQIQGTVTIDLDGYTIKTPSGWALVYSQIKPYSSSGDASLFPTELKFINGSIVLNNKGLGNFETWTSAADATITDLTAKTFTHTYKNVTFTLAANTTISSLFSITDNTHDALGYVNFTDCKFDFETKAPTSAITLFKATGSKIKVNYNITGCEIYANSMDNITLSNIAAGSSAVANRNSDGQYLMVYVKEANKETFKDETFNVNGEEKEFIEWNSLGTYSVFSLQEETNSNPLLTKYGVIPSEYKDIDNYPVVWFDEAGNFKGAANELFGTASSTTSPVHLAKTYLRDNVYDPATDSYGDNEKKAYIVLRKDYTMASNEAYGSLTQIQGVLTIDLNGYTIYQNSKPLVDSVSIRWSWSYDEAIFPTEIVIENGTIVLKDNSLVKFTAWDSNGSGDIANKKFTHTYNDVTIRLSQDATVRELFTIGQHNNTPTAQTSVYVNMNDCKFDFETVAPNNSLLLFNAGGQYIKSNYKITGSEIYAESMANITLSSIADGSLVYVDKNSDGQYLKVYVAEENKETFNETTMKTIDGEAEFVEGASVDSYAVYVLEEKTNETFDPTTLISYHNRVFASQDTFTLENGQIYTGLVGVVFAKALESSQDYTRTEYGVIISEKELTLDEFKTDTSALWAKGEKINAAFQYGIRFYGNKIKAGNTYYALPYAKYENSKGDEITAYGSEIITFEPIAE